MSQADITASDVQEVYGEKTPSLDSAKQTALTNIAENITNNNFAGKVTRQAEIEGDVDDFARYLGAFLWDIAEGDSLNQEFQTGNAEPRDAIASDPQSALSGNPYGEVCLLMLRGQGASIGIVRADF